MFLFLHRCTLNAVHRHLFVGISGYHWLEFEWSFPNQIYTRITGTTKCQITPSGLSTLVIRFDRKMDLAEFSNTCYFRFQGYITGAGSSLWETKFRFTDPVLNQHPKFFVCRWMFCTGPVSRISNWLGEGIPSILAAHCRKSIWTFGVCLPCFFLLDDRVSTVIPISPQCSIISQFLCKKKKFERGLYFDWKLFTDNIARQHREVCNFKQASGLRLLTIKPSSWREIDGRLEKELAGGQQFSRLFH